MVPDLHALPGGELVMAGLSDLHAGRTETVEALLVRIGGERLANAGLAIPPHDAAHEDAELRLYRVLSSDGGGDPYGRYNALIRRLMSCESALETLSPPYS